MSSTWFKSMEAIKCNYKTWYGTMETGYLLIAETAESNVINDNGGHDYHRWIYAYGDYYEVIQQVCRLSYNFDTGMDKWKPNHKSSEGFIRTCKKALESAKEMDKLPYYLEGIIYWQGNKEFDYLFDIFKDKENIEIKTRYSCSTIETKDVITFIKTKSVILKLIEDYKDSKHHNVIQFKDWFDENKKYYRYFQDEKVNA